MNHYEVLGVSPNAEAEVIVAAHRALIKKYHPAAFIGDKGRAEQRSRQINEAYSVMRDERRRFEYGCRWR